jgi:hypothetical protein
LTYDPIDRSRWPRCIECREPHLDLARDLCPKCCMQDFRRRHRMKACTCANCGVSFVSPRRDTVYCSQVCRQRAHRARSAPSAVAVGGMRRHGVRGLFATCQHCGHARAVNMDGWPDDATVLCFGPRMRCSSCGKLGATAVPNWIERADRLPGGARR